MGLIAGGKYLLYCSPVHPKVYNTCYVMLYLYCSEINGNTFIPTRTQQLFRKKSLDLGCLVRCINLIILYFHLFLDTTLVSLCLIFSHRVIYQQPINMNDGDNMIYESLYVRLTSQHSPCFIYIYIYKSQCQ